MSDNKRDIFEPVGINRVPLGLLHVVCAFLLLSAAALGLTFGATFSQSALNSFSGSGASAPAVLTKLERDVNGMKTVVPVPGSEFYLYKVGTGSDTQIGGRYLSGSDGKIVLPSLRPGSYYFLETAPSLGYTYDESGGSEVRSYPFDIIGDEISAVSVTAYNRRLSGSLTIQKIAQNASGDALSQSQRDQDFHFTVIFSDGGTYDCSINGGAAQPVSSGGVFVLKHGDAAVFTGIPIGVNYRVVEVPAGYWQIRSEHHSGSITSPGAVAVFSNIYDDAGFGTNATTLEVEKIVFGEMPDPDKAFAFTLYIDGQATYFTLKHSEVKSFSVPAGAVYEVLENDYFGEGFLQTIVNGYGIAKEGETIHAVQSNTFAGIVYKTISGEKTWDISSDMSAQIPDSIIVSLKKGTITVDSATVTPDGSGRWLYTFTAPKYDETNAEVTYTVEETPVQGFRPAVSGFDILNTYIKPVVLSDPPVQKRIEGGTPIDSDVFHFQMSALDGAPMPPGSFSGIKIASIAGIGSVEFGNMLFTSPGSYVYVISEIIPDDDDDDDDDGIPDDEEGFYDYDDTVYTLTVTIAENNHALYVLSREFVDGDGVSCAAAEFVNVFSEPIDRGPVDPMDPDPDESGKPGEQITISGAKVWVHGDNPPANHPSGIIVFVKANGQIVVQQVVTAFEDWKWRFSLDKYDANGYPIVYTVDEQDIPGYAKQIDGYNVINIWDPDGRLGSTGIGGGKVPLTGDNGDPSLLTALLLIDLAALLILIEIRRRVLRKYRRRTVKKV